jgi:hypothetical protein
MKRLTTGEAGVLQTFVSFASPRVQRQLLVGTLDGIACKNAVLRARLKKAAVIVIGGQFWT